MRNWIRALMCSMMLVSLSFGATAANAQSTPYWQCAPFARMFSGIQLFGAAASWWHQAIGKYAQGATPKPGAVLVFKAIGSMRSGHVATVSQVISDRIIKVTHANWSIIHGRRGQVEHDVTVVDASPNNDWSRVKVWYASLKGIGSTAYPVYGFIYGGKAKVSASAGDSEAPAAAAAKDVVTIN